LTGQWALTSLLQINAGHDSPHFPDLIFEKMGGVATASNYVTSFDRDDEFAAS
jgi:hypothetical protein